MVAQFDDGKEAGALRTIGEVAQALGIKQHVLRYWEQQFPILQPLKRSGGRRYYRPEDVALLETIDRLVNREGYTLKGAKKALSHKAMNNEHEPEALPAGEPAQAAEPIAGEPAAPLPLSLDVEVPSDGGLDAFFGRPADPVDAPPPFAAPFAPPAQAAIIVTDDLVAQLKAIRTRLADALAA